MSTFFGMFEKLAKTPLIKLQSELSGLMNELNLINIIYSYLTMTVKLDRCICNIDRSNTGHVQIYKYKFRIASQIDRFEGFGIGNPHFYLIKIIPELYNIKEYLIDFILDMEDKIKQLYSPITNLISVHYIYNLDIDVPYHEYFFNN